MRCLRTRGGGSPGSGSPRVQGDRAAVPGIGSGGAPAAPRSLRYPEKRGGSGGGDDRTEQEGKKRDGGHIEQT